MPPFNVMTTTNSALLIQVCLAIIITVLKPLNICLAMGS